MNGWMFIGLLTARFFFIEYSTPEEAQNAVHTCDGYKLDKSHIFAVNLLSDFEKSVTFNTNLLSGHSNHFMIHSKFSSFLDTNIYLKKNGVHLKEWNLKKL